MSDLSYGTTLWLYSKKGRIKCEKRFQKAMLLPNIIHKQILGPVATIMSHYLTKIFRNFMNLLKNMLFTNYVRSIL